MALIKCMHCEKEISDKATVCPRCGMPVESLHLTKKWVCEECHTECDEKDVVCPNCGCPASKEDGLQKVEIASIAVPKVDVKKYVVIIFVAVVVLLGGFMVFKGGSEKSYLSNLKNASSTMLDGAADAEAACNMISKVWRNAIYEKWDKETNKYVCPDDYYLDFNDALANLFSDPAFASDIRTIENNQEKVAGIMKKLSNPPEKYKDAYQVIKNYYSAYTSLTNLATNPTGSLQTFSSNFSSSVDDVVKSLHEIEMYL